MSIATDWSFVLRYDLKLSMLPSISPRLPYRLELCSSAQQHRERVLARSLSSGVELLKRSVTFLRAAHVPADELSTLSGEGGRDVIGCSWKQELLVAFQEAI